MARPTTKEQLLEFSDANFTKLFKLIDSLNLEDKNGTFPFEDRDKNIRDVLVHLYEWHQLLLNWVNANQSGIKTKFLPEPYNWKTYPQMNVAFWEQHQNTSFEEAVALLKKSHSEVMEMIAAFTNEELFTNQFFSWTGTTSLGSYCVSSTSSHYDWAMKKIRKYKKTIGK